jgi:uncharacterized protein
MNAKRLCTLAAALMFSCGAFAADPIRYEVNDPMTVVIKHSMQQRISRLVRFYEPGVIGLAKNGDLAISDPARLEKIATRQIVEKLIDAENSDRQAFIASIAKANNRGNEGMAEVRAGMRQRWAADMQSGWMIQDDNGNWAKKP